MVDKIKERFDHYRWAMNSLKYAFRWATGGAILGLVFWTREQAVYFVCWGYFIGVLLGTIQEIRRCLRG